MIYNSKLISRVSSLIYFFIFPSFSASVTNLDGYPDRITDLERRITLSCQSDLPDQQQQIVQSLADNVQNNLAMFAPPVVDWSNRNLSSMVSDLLFIKQEKLRLRWHPVHNPGSPYRITANLYTDYRAIGYNNAAEIAVDPYPLSIRLGVQIHRLIHNYDGGQYGGNNDHANQHQPGNCRLRQDQPRSRTISYNNGITYTDYVSDPYKLLRAIEVSRRKAIDPHRGVLQDPNAAALRNYENIPVAAGITMATMLIERNHDQVNHFWQKMPPQADPYNPHTGIYHIFTGDNTTRINHFVALTNEYRKIYDIDDANMWVLTNRIAAHAINVFGFNYVIPGNDLDDLNEAFGELGLHDLN